MTKRTILVLIASVFLTAVITLLALLLIVAFTATTAETGGINAVAGGVSAGFFSLLMAAFPILFVLVFLALLKIFKNKA